MFIKMLAFLTGGGSFGVQAFCDHITSKEAMFSTDNFNDARFDDGEQVKPQVLEFIDQMAYKDYRAGMMQSVIKEMLAKSALRPTIARVCQELAEVCFSHSGFHD